MTEKLLPCPFCGGEAIVSHVEAHSHTPILKAMIPDIDDAEDTYWPECVGCGAQRPGRNSREDAVASWNTRGDHAPCTLEPAIDEIELAAAIGTCRFMDPPDGGDVSLIEQVRRMRAALDEAEAPRTAAIAVEPIAYTTLGQIEGLKAGGTSIAFGKRDEQWNVPIYAAPTTSPELPTVKDSLTVQSSPPEIPDNSNCSISSNGSPEPDAVREALEAAEQFIVNGVDLNFIQMPDDGDPAHETLPKIQAALRFLARNDRAPPQPDTDGATK